MPTPAGEPTPEQFARAEAQWTHDVPLMACVRGLAPPALVAEARRLFESGT